MCVNLLHENLEKNGRAYWLNDLLKFCLEAYLWILGLVSPANSCRNHRLETYSHENIKMLESWSARLRYIYIYILSAVYKDCQQGVYIVSRVYILSAGSIYCQQGVYIVGRVYKLSARCIYCQQGIYCQQDVYCQQGVYIIRRLYILSAGYIYILSAVYKYCQ